MELVLFLLLTAVAAYFLGCFNGAVIISKYVLHDDVRDHGSGNAGLTNFHRTFGGGLTAVVILCDMLKMVAAVLLAAAVAESIDFDLVYLAKYWAGAFCILGHMYPCMFQFRGGKGILSGGALILLVDWRVALVGWGGFLLLTALTKWVSLGSIWAGASFPFSTCLFLQQDSNVWLLTVLAAVAGGLIVWKHRGNLQRILDGTERRFSLHRKG